MGSEAKHKDDKIPSAEQAGRMERAQWVRAAILGANDGLLSTTALMLGVGAATPAGQDRRRSVILSGLAGSVAGACSMAVGEFVSVSTQRDIEKQVQDMMIQSHENKCVEEQSTIILSNVSSNTPGRSPVMRVIQDDHQDETTINHVVVLPDPLKAAAASGLAFLSGSALPLALGIAVVSDDHRHSTSTGVARIAVLVVAATAALAALGGAGARLGGSKGLKASAMRVVVGGWLAMALTYALLKPFDTST